MSSSTLIVDYLGSGLHSARPASPSIPTGGIAFYLETDTGDLCVWNGSSWVTPNSTRVASVNLTAQVASVGATNLLATPVGALYRATGAIQLTASGTSGTVASGITYADINGTPQSEVLVPTVTFGSLNNRGNGSVEFWASASAAIQYSTTVTSAVGIPVYAAEFVLERISS